VSHLYKIVCNIATIMTVFLMTMFVILIDFFESFYVSRYLFVINMNLFNFVASVFIPCFVDNVLASWHCYTWQILQQCFSVSAVTHLLNIAVDR